MPPPLPSRERAPSTAFQFLLCCQPSRLLPSKSSSKPAFFSSSVSVLGLSGFLSSSAGASGARASRSRIGARVRVTVRCLPCERGRPRSAVLRSLYGVVQCRSGGHHDADDQLDLQEARPLRRRPLR